MSVANNFTVCVLLYGDYPELARRCLTPIVRSGLFTNHQLRIGCNAISERTQKVLDELAPDCIYYKHDTNQKKYPVMREMFHGSLPIITPYVMWFDDDSYVTADVEPWLEQIHAAMTDADIAGSLYMMRYEESRMRYIRNQPWYAGKDPKDRRDVVHFITGGWWVLRTDVITRYDYPWPALNHNGGDSLLGELCHQQDLVMKRFNTGVCINADEHGRESKSPRRGYTEKPLGVDA